MPVTKVMRLDRSDIFVNATAGERLLFRLIAQGSNPTFELTDTRAVRSLFSQQDAEERPGVWERPWPRAEELPATPTVCVMTLTFLNEITYTYQVEHSSRGMIIDIDFQAPSHEFAIQRALDIDVL